MSRLNPALPDISCQPVPKVFLSYRHENDAHRARVQTFAVKLRDAGVEVIFDGFEEEKNCGMAPPQGWPFWSIQQASDPDHLCIIAGSSGWFRVFNKYEHAPDKGLGAAAEAECIFTRMYKAAGNTFAIITSFDAAFDLMDLPVYLEKCSRLNATDDVEVTKIIAWAKGTAPMPVVSTPAPAIAWPSAVNFPEAALADRKDQCGFFSSMLTGVAPESVACVVAKSGTGKSRLLEVLKETAEAALSASHRVAYVRNLQEHTIAGLVDALCTSFGGYAQFPNYEASVERGMAEKSQHIAFFRDLRSRVTPSLVILDTWEKGSDELREWIRGHLVPCVVRAPAVKLVVAGQPHVEYPHTLPGTVRAYVLHHIEKKDWHEFIEIRYPSEAPALKETIDLCLAKNHGVKIIANILELVEKGGLTA